MNKYLNLIDRLKNISEVNKQPLTEQSFPAPSAVFLTDITLPFDDHIC